MPVDMPPCLQVANELSALNSAAGAVRVTRFDHSAVNGYDSTGINTHDFKMEYIVHFEGVRRPGNLPLLSYGRLDSVACGKKAPHGLELLTFESSIILVYLSIEPHNQVPVIANASHSYGSFHSRPPSRNLTLALRTPALS